MLDILYIMAVLEYMQCYLSSVLPLTFESYNTEV